jgi:hypothetical protein
MFADRIAGVAPIRFASDDGFVCRDCGFARHDGRAALCNGYVYGKPIEVLQGSGCPRYLRK